MRAPLPEPDSHEPSPKASETPPPPDPQMDTLDVPGFDRALVFLPARSASPPPLVVVAHGAGVVPDDICRTARALFHERAALLCLVGPRVAAREEGRYFPDHFALEKLFLASLDALGRAHVDIDRARSVYLGYSQGATMGALMLPEHGDLCPRLLLVEGGFADWTLARAERFRQRGGERVLFACGTRHCRDLANRAAETLRRAGVDAKIISDLSAGHTYEGALRERVSAELSDFLSGDARFGN